MALLFEKPSLRTRVSFEAGMIHLGGSSLFLGDDVGFGARESMADFGRVLSQYVDVVVVRAYQHQTVVELAQLLHLLGHQRPDRLRPSLPGAGRPVHAARNWSAGSKGSTLAYVGDGNNVARSLAEGCGKVGMRFVMATPEGYQFDEAFLDHLKQRRARTATCKSPTDPAEAVSDADAVYTDVWTSMGQEAEADEAPPAISPATRSTPS